jgi:cell wall-associated NlpC family hydrolase
LKLSSAISIPILAASIIGVALLAMGIGFTAPSGEQSKLVYSGNLWCVSNYVEKEPTEILSDGQPRRDPLLDGKGDWIRRDQVTATSAEEAMTKANRTGFFERSDKTQMRSALQTNNQQYFTHHYNDGATAPGPCWGSGDPTAPYVGYWISDAIKSECTGQDLASLTGANGGPTIAGNLSDGKKIRVNVTGYSPCIRPANTCDCTTGGDSGTSDGSGKFEMKNGRLQWVKSDGTAEKYVFAEPSTNNIIPWNQREEYAVVIPGFNNNQPIRIRDHYAPGNHANQNYLDLFIPCDEFAATGKQLSSLPGASGGQVDAIIVKTTSVKTATSAMGKLASLVADVASRFQVSADSATAPAPAKTTPSGATCPTEFKTGPTAGKDLISEIAASIARAYPKPATDALVGGPDVATENMIVEEAMRLAPGSDGKTKYKYSVGGRGPTTFDCSGFVDYVLKKVLARGGNVETSSNIYTRSYAQVGTVIHKIDIAKFTLPSGGAKLRTMADLPSESLLRPGDILYFGTSTACSEGAQKCPNEIGHMAIYLGNGKYIQSTTSDQDPNKDSASKGNDTSSPTIPAHSQGSQYNSYNGVKISTLSDSYFSPAFYIQTNRVTHDVTSNGYTGALGEARGLGKTANPGGSNESISYGSCHGSSACHPGERSGHGVYQNRGSGDAIDITPADGYGRAAFDGTAQSGGSGRNSFTVVTSTNGKAKAYYYHTISVKTGPVKAGDAVARIGAAGITHVHFELLIDGKSVNGDASLKSNETEYAKSLWKNMKAVLGLN